MSGGDRLSALHDDLLRRVLHFSPAREGASTSAFSKRWRGLWRSSGAVNLDARIPDDVNDAGLFSPRDAFLSAAMLSLQAAAADSPVTRLSFRLDPGCDDIRAMKFLSFNMGLNIRKPDVPTELLSLPAARRVEELRLAADHRMALMDQEEVTSPPSGLFNNLKFVSLPWETLRVLDMSSCGFLEPTAGVGVAFPRLASLRLSLFSAWVKDLQEFLLSAPSLAIIHLESVMLQSMEREKGSIIRLHCPAATNKLVLDRCGWERETYNIRGTTAVEISAPRLRHFMYKGLLRQLSLSSQVSDLTRAHLHIFPGRSDLVTFWRLVGNFRNANELKLRVNMLEDIAVVSPAKLLFSFRKLGRLHMEGMHGLDGTTAAVAGAAPCSVTSE